MPASPLHPDPATLAALQDSAAFARRHIGITPEAEAQMLAAIGYSSRAALLDAVVPAAIRRQAPMQLPPAASEVQALDELKTLARRNRLLKSFIGQGYYGTHTPAVILRNVLENPAWYTAYTPYQAEISQGRLEALLNFQTMVCDLSAMPLANASMLDEASAAAEAMALARRVVKNASTRFLVCADVHPQTVQVLQTRAAPLGLEVVLAATREEFSALLQEDYFAALVQYPASSGRVDDWRGVAEQVHAQNAALIVAADLLALTLLEPPGAWGADITVGSTQRFGMPMGAGGPHAAYMACRDEYKRSLPGRLVGVSVDAHGNPALRLALQTREQHIRREKATSNICTAQVLPAVVASMYAVYHGPQGLAQIARRVARYAAIAAHGLRQLGAPLRAHGAFDTLALDTGADTARIAARAVELGANLRIGDGWLGVALDETTTAEDVQLIWRIFAAPGAQLPDFAACAAQVEQAGPGASLLPPGLLRSSAYLAHPVFNRHHSETAMLRYIRQLSDQDLALDRGMIALGSCTMKLNATSSMLPMTWPEFAKLHPFAPPAQQQGLLDMEHQLRAWLCEITGYAGISLQPNAGSQGEYAGLLAIKNWHASRGDHQRTICLIPASAHGTNPASAQMAGLQVVVTACDAQGNIDVADWQAQCEKHSQQLACAMITYPSTHGVFEEKIGELCRLVRQHGGRVYIDGANMNALVGLAAPGAFGGDVSHLNLHKTFSIPHGGGGPGVGPVCVAQDLLPFLPGHACTASTTQAGATGAISAAPLGNAAALPISWMYIRMLGAHGLRQASEVAILSANYISARLKDHYPTLYAGANGLVAHECILDLRAFKERSGISAEDVAKRLMDCGLHAPTLSFPVPGTLMVEPTESEDLAELERFISAMLAIRAEIRAVENGQMPRADNPVRNAPHTAARLLAEPWPHPYPRAQAAWPVPGMAQHNKYWPPVARIDNVHGDRHLQCTCPPVSAWAQAE